MEYPNLKINGRLFPIWILKNYKKFKLDDIIIKSGEDPCQNKENKLTLRKYQEFISQYMDIKSPYHDVLVYHGLGSGKGATTLTVYNVLYNATPGWNVYLLIKASLEGTWEKQIKLWMEKQDFDHRYSNIKFINYDSPFADTEFMDAIKNSDSSKKNLYIIEESHNFIRNVYSNITQKKGKRAINIYDYIIQDKKDNPSTRVLCLSGTPAINRPYELAILFNLLRPGIFPKEEILFDQYFIESSGGSPVINPKTKNMFQRRIMGLVSYYIGATPEYYARPVLKEVEVKLSEYQTEIYKYYEDVEKKMESSGKQKTSSSSETYKTYTRQSVNFVFPPIDDLVTGENRPRPSKFRISANEMEKIMKTKSTEEIKSLKSSQSQQYFVMLEKFLNTFDEHLEKLYNKDRQSGNTLEKDIEKFKNYENFEEFITKEKTTSSIIKEMHKCSVKMTTIIFHIMKSKGPVLVYTNYVIMEGIDVFKVYLKYFGFEYYNNKNCLSDSSKDNLRYAEFHNGISKEERFRSVDLETDPENKTGKIIKIMLFSPAGAEGISLSNIRQVHIMEPYWNEVRIVQMIGRAIRQCSHRDLPMEERYVDIYRYKAVRHNIQKKEIIEGQTVRTEYVEITDSYKLRTVDHEIETLAKNKNNLIESFLSAVKEVAIDCELYKSHNMLAGKYKCFKFNETSLFDKNIGPAYKEDVIEDLRYNNGSNSTNSITINVKAVKIKGVEVESKEIVEYWYSSDTGTIYDLELHYPVGRVKLTIEGFPEKLDKETYRVDLLNIPTINKIKK